MRLFVSSRLLQPAQQSIVKTILIRKLITAFILLFSLAATARGFSQQLSISVRNAPLSAVFKEISRQTGYSFVYTTDMLKNTRNVSIQVNNASLEQTLELCFKDQPVTYAIVDKMIAVREKTQRNMINEVAPPVVLSGRY